MISGASSAQAAGWDLDADADAPVLIFEIDAAGIAEESAPAHRAQVRLIGSVRPDGGHFSDDHQLSAVVVLRALTPSRLLSCVRAVTRSGVTVPPEVLCEMLPTRPDGAGVEGGASVADRLTDREIEVLRRLAAGDSTRDLARHLSYSERTVKNIIHDLLAKLDSRTRAQAVALAARQGVI